MNQNLVRAPDQEAPARQPLDPCHPVHIRHLEKGDIAVGRTLYDPLRGLLYRIGAIVFRRRGSGRIVEEVVKTRVDEGKLLHVVTPED